MNDSDAADRTTRRGHQRRRVPAGKPRVSVDSFRRDPMYPQVERAVAAILASSKVVAPVDVIVRLGWLSTADLEKSEDMLAQLSAHETARAAKRSRERRAR